MRFSKFLGAACVAMSLAFAVHAQDDSGVERLNRYLSEIKSLEALFTQEVISEKGEILQTATGRLQLAQPGKFHWEYVLPAPQQIISDGKTVWFYDTQLSQVTVKKLDDAIGNTPAAILTQGQQIGAHFEVHERPEREGLKWVELLPKKSDTDFRRVLIGLDDENVQGMDLYDQFGQITVIRFMDTVNNPELPNSNFNFTPPPGVDVVGSPF
ncbi:MAG: outer membrane lipoprotein chaperone LolA [Thiotrichales bacterium]